MKRLMTISISINTFFDRLKSLRIKSRIKSFASDKEVIVLSFLSFAFTLLFYVLALDKGEDSFKYLATIPIVLLCDMVLIILYKIYKPNYLLVLILIFIFHMGILYRNLCDAETVWNDYKILVSGIICLLIGVFSVKILDQINFNRIINIICIFGTASVYVILRVLGKAFGNKGHETFSTIGHIQVTEFIKIIAIIYLALLFSSNKMKEKTKLIYASIFIGVNCAGSVLIKEMGSLLVMILVFIIYLVLFIKSKILLAVYFIAGSILALIGTLFVYLLKGNVIDTISVRVKIWLHPEFDPVDKGAQAIQAKEAIINGGFFGSNRTMPVPAIKTDFAFVGVVAKLGLILCFVLLIMFAIFLVNGAIEYLKARTRFHSALIVGCVYYIFLQALVMFAGSTGVIPMTGITVPLISKGGASIVATFMMIGIIIGTHYKASGLETRDIPIDEMLLAEEQPTEKDSIMENDFGGDFDIDVYYRSEIGNRTENQDDYYVDIVNNIFAIFDGMGGGIKGGEASDRLKRIISEKIPAIIETESDTDSFIERVDKVVREISNDFHEEYNKDRFNYGATIAMIVRFNEEYILFNAGDSRIYSFGIDKTIKLETIDHNVAWNARKDGMSENEIKRRNLASRLLRYVGAKDILTDVHRIRCGKVRGFLLATDGLYASLSNYEMLKVFENGQNAQEILDELIEESLSRDGSDNTSGICIANIQEEDPIDFENTKNLVGHQDFEDTEDLIITDDIGTTAILEIPGNPPDIVQKEEEPITGEEEEPNEGDGLGGTKRLD